MHCAACTVQELRRGADSAHIYSLSFSRGCEWLAASSDKSTVHVWSLSGNGAAGGGQSQGGQAPGAGAQGQQGSGAAAGAGQQGPGAGAAGAVEGADGESKQRGNPTSILSVVKVSAVQGARDCGACGRKAVRTAQKRQGSTTWDRVVTKLA